MFHDLKEEFWIKLEKLATKKIFGEGEQIFAEGEKADFLPIVLRGCVKMVRYPEAGKEVIIGVFGDGEVFAIAPALDGKAFPATAVAKEETQLLMVPRQALIALMKESSELATLLMARMCGLLRDRTATVQILAMSSADHRVGNVLLNLASANDCRCPLEIPFRRQEIAEMSGLTIETTIRSVRKLEKRGYLKIVNRKIVLESTEPLKRLLQI